jgi:hypothetical protein
MGPIVSHLLRCESLTSSSFSLTGTVFGDGLYQILKCSTRIPKAVHYVYVNVQFSNTDKVEQA